MNPKDVYVGQRVFVRKASHPHHLKQGTVITTHHILDELYTADVVFDSLSNRLFRFFREETLALEVLP
jgi:hypothetical protein